MASSIGNRLSRDDWKKSKELEELRKTGAAPPELDEDGKMINPHIPQYVSEAPWYLKINRPSLKHQYTNHFGGPKHNYAGTESVYKRGKKKVRNSRWVEGSCENCGAKTHTKKECVERPRRRNAKLTGDNLEADEYIPKEFELDYDGKRDRWAGYDPSTYIKVIEHHQKTRDVRRQQKAKELDKAMKEKMAEKKKKKEQKLKKKAEDAANGENGSDTDESDTDESDTEDEEDSDRDELADSGKVMQKRDLKSRTTVRNLRIREDTAKYLLNLDPNSAYYDAKARSMRENPFPDKDPTQVPFAGDNFYRYQGDTKKQIQLQHFINQSVEKGNDEIHVLTNPSQAEKAYAEFIARKAKLKESRKTNVFAKYGGQEHLQMPDRDQLLGQSEHYAEYNEMGEIVKGQEKAIPKTKYIEDVYENNHTSVWGSFWKAGRWGYGCCHATMRSAYCTGEAGRNASAAKLLQSSGAAKQLMPPPSKKKPASLNIDTVDDELLEEEVDTSKKSSKKKKKKRKRESSSDDSDSSDSDRAKKRKLERALRKERLRQKGQLPGSVETEGYGNGKGEDVNAKPTDEEMLAHQMLRPRAGDTMADYVDDGTLLD